MRGSLELVEKTFRVAFFVMIICTFMIVFTIFYVGATYGLSSWELYATLLVFSLFMLAIYAVIRVFYYESDGEGKYPMVDLFKSVLYGLATYASIAAVISICFIVFGFSWQWLMICVATALVSVFLLVIFNTRKQALEDTNPILEVTS